MDLGLFLMHVELALSNWSLIIRVFCLFAMFFTMFGSHSFNNKYINTKMNEMTSVKRFYSTMYPKLTFALIIEELKQRKLKQIIIVIAF
jgi:hypothetical protein